MNYLAHAYLSFNLPDILFGNMISDHVKGKKMYDFSNSIVNGIKIHRKIDEFTDNHSITKKIRSFFTASYGLYHAVFSDIVCDYFLANDVKIFESATALKLFTSDCYTIMDRFELQMPSAFISIYPHMRQHDWLYNYKFHSGMQKSFAGIVSRAKYMNDSQPALEILIKNEDELRGLYEKFFPELYDHTADNLQKLVKND